MAGNVVGPFFYSASLSVGVLFFYSLKNGVLPSFVNLIPANNSARVEP